LDRHQLQDDVDVLTIYDGPSINNSLIMFFSDSGFPNIPVISSGSQILVQFTSFSSGIQFSGFTLKWSVNSLCPDSCNSHGYCISGECKCFSGFSGANCTSFVLGNPFSPASGIISDTVGEFEWNFYYIDVPSNSLSLVVSFSKTLMPIPPKPRWGGGHPQFFLRYVLEPDFVDFACAADYFDFSYFYIVYPLQGRFYLGVFGLEASSYIISVAPFTAVPPTTIPSITHIPLVSSEQNIIVPATHNKYSKPALALGILFAIFTVLGVIGAVILLIRYKARRDFKEISETPTNSHYKL